MDFSHRKEFDEILSRKARGTFKIFPRFASAHCIHRKFDKYSFHPLQFEFWPQVFLLGEFRHPVNLWYFNNYAFLSRSSSLSSISAEIEFDGSSRPSRSTRLANNRRHCCKDLQWEMDHNS